MLLEEDDQQQSREQAEGEIDIKDPAPREMINDQPTQRWTNNAGEAPHAAEEPLHPGSLFQRKNIANDGEYNGQNCARAQALDSAEDDELLHRLGCSRGNRPEQK